METDRSEDSGAGGRIIIKYIKNMNGWRGLGAVRLGQNRDKLWAVVNTAINLKIPQIVGISWLAKELLTSQCGTVFIEYFECNN